MDRRRFLVTGAVASAMTGAAAVAQSGPRALASGGHRGPASPDRPNILFIVSDQHRAGMSRREGFPFDTKPTLDRYAATGLDFSRAYCTIPECCPSRVSMLTGRWPEATRVRMNFAAKDAFFTKDLYDVARDQGYRTGLIGKNHTYLERDDLDFWREYHELSGYVAADADPRSAAYEKWLGSTHFNVTTEPTPFPVEAQHPFRMVSDAIGFMDAAPTERFILQLSFPEVHNPEQVSAPYWDMFPPSAIPARLTGPEALGKMGDRERWLYGLETTAYPDTEKNWRRYVSNYLGQMRLVDDQFKRLFDHMETTGVMKNTVVVMLADHGDYMMDYGLARKGVGMPDCLARIPMIWFGACIRPDAHRQDAVHTSMADVMPTLCEFMQADIPLGVQGRSLAPILRGADYPAEEFRSIYATSGVGGLYYETQDQIPYSISRYGENGWDELNMVTQSGNQKMVRMGDWKLMYDMMGNGQLYHLPTDPAELNNRFDDPTAATDRNRLMAELLMWTIRNQDDLPTGRQNKQYRTKEPAEHNWFTPYRRAPIGTAYRG